MNRKLMGALIIILQELLTLRPYRTYEKGIKIKKKDYDYLFLGSKSQFSSLSPAPNFSVIENFRHNKQP
jgi:hypothetical protein